MLHSDCIAAAAISTLVFHLWIKLEVNTTVNLLLKIPCCWRTSPSPNLTSQPCKPPLDCLCG